MGKYLFSLIVIGLWAWSDLRWGHSFTRQTKFSVSRSMACKQIDPTVEQVVQRIMDCEKIIVLSGAGMSTAAGIPDFRSPGGLYGSSEVLLDRFTFLEDALCSAEEQRKALRK